MNYLKYMVATFAKCVCKGISDGFYMMAAECDVVSYELSLTFPPPPPKPVYPRKDVN